MDASEFEQQARADADISALLREVAEAAGDTEDVDVEPKRYLTVTGVDLLLAIIAYSLYRFFKDYYDHQRALNETLTVEKRAQLIRSLIGDGFPPEKAEKVVNGLLATLAKRNQDDPALAKALALLGKDEK